MHYLLIYIPDMFHTCSSRIRVNLHDLTYDLEIPHMFHIFFSESRHHRCGSAVSFRVAHLHPRRRFHRITLEEVNQTLQRRTANEETGAGEGEKQQQPEMKLRKHH